MSHDTQERIKDLTKQYPPDNSYPYPMVQIPEKDLVTFVAQVENEAYENFVAEIEDLIPTGTDEIDDAQFLKQRLIKRMSSLKSSPPVVEKAIKDWNIQADDLMNS